MTKKIVILIWAIIITKFSLATNYQDLSEYERQVVDSALEKYSLESAANTKNKKIHQIHVFTQEPFGEKSGVFSYLNYVHVNTRDDIILRELFFKSQDLYDPELIRDSESVLRSQVLVRSLVVIVPVIKKQGQPKNTVDLLVATKDLLSLRPSFNFKFSGSTLNSLLVAVGEHNFLGYNKSIAAIYELNQSMHLFSARYYDSRLFGSRWALTVKPEVVLSKDNFSYDGFISSIKLERPLLAISDKWGYGVSASYGSKPIIKFTGEKIRTYDIPETEISESIEQRYRWRFGSGKLRAIRSFGRLHKKEVAFGYGLNIKRPSVPDRLGLSQEEKKFFIRDVLPRNEIESFVFLGLSYFQNRFLYLHDYNNYQLQETIRLGPTISVGSDFAAQQALFSDHNFIRPKTAIGYVQALGKDAFLSIWGSSTNRYDGLFKDNIYKTGLRVISPMMWDVARIIFASNLSLTYKNRDNQAFSLGGNSGLRGLVSSAFRGSKALRGNLEIRSAPLKLWIFHAGLAVFYDVGDAFNKWDKVNLNHTLGLGIRVLAPQISSQLFRIDLGFPIFGRQSRNKIVVPTGGTGQAF